MQIISFNTVLLALYIIVAVSSVSGQGNYQPTTEQTQTEDQNTNYQPTMQQTQIPEKFNNYKPTTQKTQSLEKNINYQPTTQQTKSPEQKAAERQRASRVLDTVATGLGAGGLFDPAMILKTVSAGVGAGGMKSGLGAPVKKIRRNF